MAAKARQPGLVHIDVAGIADGVVVLRGALGLPVPVHQHGIVLAGGLHVDIAGMLVAGAEAPALERPGVVLIAMPRRRSAAKADDGGILVPAAAHHHEAAVVEVLAGRKLVKAHRRDGGVVGYKVHPREFIRLGRGHLVGVVLELTVAVRGGRQVREEGSLPAPLRWPGSEK